MEKQQNKQLNLKLRLQQKWFWIALISLLGLLSQQLGLNLPENIEAIANTVLSIGVLLGVVNDPTTAGFWDSERAMTYDKPYEATEEHEVIIEE